MEEDVDDVVEEEEDDVEEEEVDDEMVDEADVLGGRCSHLMSSRPMPVHTSSRRRTMRATKMPVDAVMPSAAADIKNPPSRPPSCSGMKNSILANSEVKANISMHCTYVTCGVSTMMVK